MTSERIFTTELNACAQYSTRVFAGTVLGTRRNQRGENTPSGHCYLELIEKEEQS